MTASLHHTSGRRTWSLDISPDGTRTYSVEFLVYCTSASDGPQTVANTPGLPLIGAPWTYGNDSDFWALCTPFMRVQQITSNEPGFWWTVQCTFTNRPMQRCWDTSIEDPLLEPPKVSGTFVKYTEEAAYDRNGDRILSSSHEQLRGSQLEFDANRPTVRIEQNVAVLGLETFSEMVNGVNDDVLWGLAARKIKLSNVTWERKYHGSCDIYYTRIFDFDIKFDTFDRDVGDEGSRVLGGKGTGWVTSGADKGKFKVFATNDPGAGTDDPDPDNPHHFVAYRDRSGELARVLLDGGGLPSNAAIIGEITKTSGAAAKITVEKYSSVDLLTLGIPTIL